MNSLTLLCGAMQYSYLISTWKHYSQPASYSERQAVYRTCTAELDFGARRSCVTQRCASEDGTRSANDDDDGGSTLDRFTLRRSDKLKRMTNRTKQARFTHNNDRQKPDICTLYKLYLASFIHERRNASDFIKRKYYMRYRRIDWLRRLELHFAAKLRFCFSWHQTSNRLRSPCNCALRWKSPALRDPGHNFVVRFIRTLFTCGTD